MARYDKYQPLAGGFRAPLAAAIVAAEDATNQVGIPLAMGLDGQGRAVIGAGNTGVLGVYVADQAKAVGDIADIMTAGEIVDLDGAAFVPGTTYFGQTDGSVNATAGGARVGFTVGDVSVTTGEVRPRLVVRSVPVDATGV